MNFNDNKEDPNFSPNKKKKEKHTPTNIKTNIKKSPYCSSIGPLKKVKSNIKNDFFEVDDCDETGESFLHISDTFTNNDNEIELKKKHHKSIAKHTLKRFTDKLSNAIVYIFFYIFIE